MACPFLLAALPAVDLAVPPAAQMAAVPAAELAAPAAAELAAPAAAELAVVPAAAQMAAPPAAAPVAASPAASAPAAAEEEVGPWRVQGAGWEVSVEEQWGPGWEVEEGDASGRQQQQQPAAPPPRVGQEVWLEMQHSPVRPAASACLSTDCGEVIPSWEAPLEGGEAGVRMIVSAEREGGEAVEDSWMASLP